MSSIRIPRATGASVERGAWFGLVYDCRGEDDRKRAAKYVSKLGHEISGEGKKAAEEHWTLGEIFKRAASGDRLFVALVREYQVSTHGRRIYQLDKRARKKHDESEPLPEQVVLQEWRTIVDRLEFSGLSRAERYGGLSCAVYLPLEAGATARGDPAAFIQETIDSILRAHDSEGTRAPQKLPI